MFGRNVRTDELRSAAVGAVGLVVLVLGTFLPWLQSGRTTRNSYETGGAIRRLIGTTGLVDYLFVLWPLVGIACAAAVALFLFGLRTLGALVAGLAALAAGAAGIGALAATANSYAQVVIIGPVVTLIGATLVALAVLLRALVAVAVPRSPQ
jgi:uncharacterized membrane protein